MRVVIQRVKKAEVFVNNRLISSIDTGLLLFVGFSKKDSEEDLKKAASKIVNLRIFEDSYGKFNFSLKDKGFKILCVSQFTLYADLKKGRRPSFEESLEYEKAQIYFDTFCKYIEMEGVEVKRGIFGEKMLVYLENWGPATFILDTQQI